MKILKIITLLLSLSLAACGIKTPFGESALPPQGSQSSTDGDTTQSVARERGDILLPYDSTAGLSPYLIKSQINKAICSLLFDPLVKLDEHFTPVLYLSETVDSEGLIYTITIKKDISFSDGSILEASDVVASVQGARANGSYYQKMLENIAAVSAADAYTVLITLKEPDREFINLLTFPIVKAGTVNNAIPIGSGRYVFEGGAQPSLVSREDHFEGGMHIERIKLVPTPDSESLSYGLKVGNINYIYSDLSSGGRVNTFGSTLPVNQNNFVFLGLNNNRKLLANPLFRKAIGLAINREVLVTNIYSNRATAAYTPYNPLWPDAPALRIAHDTGKVNEMLDGLGYTERAQNQLRLFENEPITLKLLVNMENRYREDSAKMIAEQLALTGIGVEIEALPFDQYKSALQSGNFDMYIGEIKLMDNMDLTPFFGIGAAASYGITRNDQLVTLYTNTRAGLAEYEEFLEAFGELMPFIPLLYRQGTVSFSRDFYTNIIATEQDIFYNFKDWTY